MVARSEAQPHVSVPNKQKFPWIGVSSGGSIVLFTEESKGTVIGHTTLASPTVRANNPFGMNYVAWVSSGFAQYSGKVTLYNE